VGEHGHTSTIFKRAIERGNVVAAELALREADQVDLGDALEFVILVALRNRTRSRRMCVRWLERYVGETPGVEIETVAVLAGLLAVLGGPDHLRAASALRSMAERASGAPRT
jgi:hypothetical protein